VKFYLERVGLTCHFRNPKLVSDSRFKKIISNRLKYLFVELWHSYISSATSNKLRFYKLVKNSFGKEPYLNSVPIYHLRKAITKFRCSDHNLEIEKGRHTNKKREERVCKVCNKSIEDEIHFLNNCQNYNELRTHYFGGGSGTFNWLRTVQCATKEYAFKLGNFLTKAYKYKTKILKVVLPPNCDMFGCHILFYERYFSACACFDFVCSLFFLSLVKVFVEFPIMLNCNFYARIFYEINK